MEEQIKNLQGLKDALINLSADLWVADDMNDVDTTIKIVIGGKEFSIELCSNLYIGLIKGIDAELEDLKD